MNIHPTMPVVDITGSRGYGAYVVPVVKKGVIVGTLILNGGCDYANGEDWSWQTHMNPPKTAAELAVELADLHEAITHIGAGMAICTTSTTAQLRDQLGKLTEEYGRAKLREAKAR